MKELKKGPLKYSPMTQNIIALIAVVAILAFVIFVQCSPEPVKISPKNTNTVSKTEAHLLCANAFESFTAHKARVSVYGGFKLFETTESWIYKIEGELQQNEYGTWYKYIGHCDVPKNRQYKGIDYDPRNIKTFEYIPVD